MIAVLFWEQPYFSRMFLSLSRYSLLELIINIIIVSVYFIAKININKSIFLPTDKSIFQNHRFWHVVIAVTIIK